MIQEMNMNKMGTETITVTSINYYFVTKAMMENCYRVVKYSGFQGK